MNAKCLGRFQSFFASYFYKCLASWKTRRNFAVIAICRYDKNNTVPFA
jgi:hypothetical protein